MSTVFTDHLFAAVDVSVEAFALCEIADDTCLVTPPVAAIEVHYVVAGTLHFSVPGVAPLTLGEGALVITPAGMPQRLSATVDPAYEVAAGEVCAAGPDGMILFDASVCGIGDVRLLCGKVHADIAGTFGPLDGLTRPIAGEFADSPFVRGAFEAMVAETRAGAAGARSLVATLMKACLLALLRRHLLTAPPEPGLMARPGLARAIVQVMSMPAVAHTVSSLASEAGMSRSAFAKAFGEVTGVSPMVFVARTRLLKARDLLTGSDLTVATIAQSVGLASRSHFSRLFRTSYGCDPSTYRRLARAGDPPLALVRRGMGEMPDGRASR